MFDEEDESEGFAMSGKLWTLILLGMALVFIGIAVVVVASIFSGGSGSVGGVIFIGPIPIFFGVGPDMTWLIALGAAISIISIIAFVVLNRSSKKE